MQPAPSELETAPTAKQPTKHSADFDEKSAPRNFMVLVAHQVLMRTGWIFKTESIIMPAVLDSLGARGWLRGCLPMFNRFGQSVPPLLMARRLKVMPRKKWALLACGVLMSVCFLALSAIWFAVDGALRSWMPLTFLLVYAIFFMGTGINQLCFNTLQGKVVKTTRRGRLMLVANVTGGLSAISCAWLLLPRWLEPGNANFALIFGFTGVSFAAAAAVTWLLEERADAYGQPRSGVGAVFKSAARTLRQDVHFRRFAIVGALFGVSMMLFPHYQALGRAGRDETDLSMLTLWVVVQNAGTALFSMFVGPIADRFGNRLVLRLTLFIICVAPLFALGLAAWGPPGQKWFSFVFIMVGLTPVVIRTLNNYTLEISDPADHPRYLSTLNLCVAAPAMASPLLGLLVDRLDFGPVFGVVSGVVFAGWLMSFRLHEPRHG